MAETQAKSAVARVAQWRCATADAAAQPARGRLVAAAKRVSALARVRQWRRSLAEAEAESAPASVSRQECAAAMVVCRWRRAWRSYPEFGRGSAPPSAAP